DRGRADVELALYLRGWRQGAFHRPWNTGAVVEAVAFGRGHQPCRAELGAKGGEHGVAGHRERQFEGTAAFLVVGITQLHSVERRVGRVGEDTVRVGEPGLQHAREGNHLERRARRLQIVDTEPGDGQYLSG